jgi:hypothetical protein
MQFRNTTCQPGRIERAEWRAVRAADKKIA